MEFRLLGPLEVVGDDGVPVALGGPRPRALLARLLLEPNRAVSNDRLIDAIWGEAPPPSAHNALQVHVHALRAALGPDRIETRAPGYLLHVHPGELDADRFHELVQRGGERPSGRARPLAGAGPRRSGRRALRPRRRRAARRIAARRPRGPHRP